MLADQLKGKDTCYCQNIIIALDSHVMLCSDHFSWCLLSVLNLVTPLSFESREEGAGGDIPL